MVDYPFYSYHDYDASDRPDAGGTFVLIKNYADGSTAIKRWSGDTIIANYGVNTALYPVGMPGQYVNLLISRAGAISAGAVDTPGIGAETITQITQSVNDSAGGYSFISGFSALALPIAIGLGVFYFWRRKK